MPLDFVHKHLHIGGRQSVVGDSGIQIALKLIQEAELISIERLGNEMGDVHRKRRRSVGCLRIAKQIEQGLGCGDHVAHAEFAFLTSNFDG